MFYMSFEIMVGLSHTPETVFVDDPGRGDHVPGCLRYQSKAISVDVWFYAAFSLWIDGGWSCYVFDFSFLDF